MADKLPWRELNAFVEEITSATDREEFLGKLLSAVGRLIPYAVAASLNDNHGRCHRCVGMDEATVEAYNSHYVHTLDMLQQSWEEIETNGSRVDVLNWRRMPSGEFSADFARPNGISSTLSHFLPGRRWSVSIHRGAGEPLFSDCERFVVVAINRHINQLLKLYDRLEERPSGSPSADRIRECYPGLSPREAQVCSLYCMGISAPAIASRLGVSHRTVEAQIGSVYLKLGISAKSELMRTIGSACRTRDKDAPLAVAAG